MLPICVRWQRRASVAVMADKPVISIPEGEPPAELTTVDDIVGEGDEGDEGARGLAEHVADGLGVGDRADEGEAGSPAFVAWAFCAHKRNGVIPY